MVGFQDMIYTLDRIGVADVLLPFILIFTVAFAVLQKSNIWGDDPASRKYNAIISMVMGLVVVIPHIMGWYPHQDADVVNIINRALPNVAVVLVAVLMVLMIIGIFGGKATWTQGWVHGALMLIAFAVIVFIFGSAAGWFEVLPSWLYWLGDPSTQAILLVSFVFGLIIYFITKEDDDGTDAEGKPKESALHQLSKLFGDGK